MRFVLDPNAGDGGFLIWNEQVIPAIIDWLDPVVRHGLHHKIKYVRLVRRKASSPQAQGADHVGNRYFVQLVLEGHAYLKPRHRAGGDRYRWSGYRTSDARSCGREGSRRSGHVLRRARAQCQKEAAIAAQDGAPTTRQQSRPLRRTRARQGRRKACRWKESKRYQATRRRHAQTERKLAAHRKSLHGKLAHRIARVGSTITIEKTSFKAWQKQYGRSIGLRAPGMFVAHLARIVAKTGGSLREVSAYQTKLSQYCHHCGQYRKKPRSERWHQCPVWL